MTISRTRPLEREPAELLYDHLMELHGQLFATERFAAAYHQLAAALHVAEELDDPERLSTIQGLAARRQDHIDGTQAAHVMSSASAKVRGHTSRFTSLARTAKAACGRINADRVVRRNREARG
jgi:hypothetical protein